MIKKKQAIRGQANKREQLIWQDYVQPVVANIWLRKLVIVSLAISAVFGVWHQLSSSKVLPIEKVQIEGEFKYLSKQHLQQHAKPFYYHQRRFIRGEADPGGDCHRAGAPRPIRSAHHALRR